MKYRALTDQEIEEQKYFLQEGEATFVVLTAIEAVSKKGNNMISLELDVTDSLGGCQKIDDWLVLTDKMIFKLKHFLESIGQADEYEKEEIQPLSLINARGHCLLKFEKSKDPNYRDRMKVFDYTLEGDSTENIENSSKSEPAGGEGYKAFQEVNHKLTPTSGPAKDFDDDIPF